MKRPRFVETLQALARQQQVALLVDRLEHLQQVQIRSTDAHDAASALESGALTCPLWNLISTAQETAPKHSANLRGSEGAYWC